MNTNYQVNTCIVLYSAGIFIKRTQDSSNEPKFMYMNIIPTEQVLTFMLGGKARFILWNQESGGRFEYMIKRSSKVGTVWNVYYAYTYIGSLYTWYEHLQFKISKGIIPNELPVKAIMWYLNKLIHNPVSIPDNVVIYHLGTCSVCNRKLKDPESVKRGIGPECFKSITQRI